MLGQERDDLVELEHRARPAVREQQRRRASLARRRMDEVHVDVITDLRPRLARTRYPDESSLPPWSTGTSVAYLKSMIDYRPERLRLARVGGKTQRVPAVHAARARHTALLDNTGLFGVAFAVQPYLTASERRMAGKGQLARRREDAHTVVGVGHKSA